ncbi:hypothetical protein D3C80_1505570 [compost metagenome]
MCIYIVLCFGNGASQIPFADREFYSDKPFCIVAVYESRSGDLLHCCNFFQRNPVSGNGRNHQHQDIFFVFTEVFIITDPDIEFLFSFVFLRCGFSTDCHFNHSLSFGFCNSVDRHFFFIQNNTHLRLSHISKNSDILDSGNILDLSDDLIGIFVQFVQIVAVNLNCIGGFDTCSSFSYVVNDRLGIVECNSLINAQALIHFIHDSIHGDFPFPFRFRV